MTEPEWLACEDTAPMLAFVGVVAHARKQRLFFCALCRNAWHLLVESSSREAIEVAERYADGQATEDERATANYYAEACVLPQPPEFAQRAAAYLAEYATNKHILSLEEEGAFGFHPYCEWYFKHIAAVRAPAAQLVREIFGNPFRPVSFNPAWRTDTAVAVARQMYDAREFGAMPILADALQDAGCDSEEVLSHCRDANAVHVRGCWVCDLVLGKV
jgi:hypothetical protein